MDASRGLPRGGKGKHTLPGAGEMRRQVPQHRRAAATLFAVRSAQGTLGGLGDEGLVKAADDNVHQIYQEYGEGSRQRLWRNRRDAPLTAGQRRRHAPERRLA